MPQKAICARHGACRLARVREPAASRGAAGGRERARAPGLAAVTPFLRLA